MFLPCINCTPNKAARLALVAFSILLSQLPPVCLHSCLPLTTGSHCSEALWEIPIARLFLYPPATGWWTPTREVWGSPPTVTDSLMTPRLLSGPTALPCMQPCGCPSHQQHRRTAASTSYQGGSMMKVFTHLGGCISHLPCRQFCTCWVQPN